MLFEDAHRRVDPAGAAAGLLTALLIWSSPTSSARSAVAPPAPVPAYRAAPAGKYALDPARTGVVVRVPQVGLSHSVFRFLTIAGTLLWDPANPHANALNITVDPKPTAPPSPRDIANEIFAGSFAKAAHFPRAIFVSRRFQITNASHGKVDGDFTMMGVTKPMTVDVDLVEVGSDVSGASMGVHATTVLHTSEFGFLPQFFGQRVELIVDCQFEKRAS